MPSQQRAATSAEAAITISMSPDTVDALLSRHAFLYAFKAVESSDGQPLVWARQEQYSPTTIQSWSRSYGAYTALTPSAGRPMVVGWSTAVDLGQLLQVNSPAGDGTVVNDGSSGAVSIANNTGDRFACGIGQSTDGEFAPECVMDLPAGSLEVIRPLDRVLLLFAGRDVPPGTVVTGPFFDNCLAQDLYSPAVMVDSTGVDNRPVGFDLGSGWSWSDNATWATHVAAYADLVPLLIQPPSS